jgi:hypothetical protein
MKRSRDGSALWSSPKFVLHTVPMESLTDPKTERISEEIRERLSAISPSLRGLCVFILDERIHVTGFVNSFYVRQQVIEYCKAQSKGMTLVDQVVVQSDSI